MTARYREPPPRPTSILLGKTWTLAAVGEVRLEVPRPQDLRLVDAAWGAHRGAGDPADHWSWYDIAIASVDRFALVAENGEILCLWSSEGGRPLMLREGFAYRLDRLEVAPRLRRAGVGAFTMCLVAARAIERGASEVVYSAIDHPDTLAFHDALGAERRVAEGWRPAAGLVPYVLTQSIVTTLAARAR